MKLIGIIAALCLVALTAAGFVLAIDDNGNATRWDLAALPASVSTNVVNPSTRAVRYFLASDGWSATNAAAELNAVRAAFGQWQSITGTSVKFEEGGLLAPGVYVNITDGTNAISWAKTNTLVNNDLDNIYGSLAVTFTNKIGGVLCDVDIVFNGVQYAWFTDFNDTNNPGYSLEASALHEIGHFLGLLHSPVGGATMLSRSSSGIGTQFGLSPDDIAAARFLYPAQPAPTNIATLRGTVTRGGTPVFGAMVMAEDAAGNLAAGTLSESDGRYQLPVLPPGDYQVRVIPLDPANAPDHLESGSDFRGRFAGLGGDFLPTTNTPVSLAAGATNTLDFSVISGTPAFYLTHIRPSGPVTAFNTPATVRPGQSNLTVGVVSPNGPTNGVTLSLTGDGLTVGGTVVDTSAFPGFSLITTTLGVASNATPGSRTFVVQAGTNFAYANGFLEILPLMPDNNFDGLDDRFQRKYFPVFTAAEAAPSADPDGDGLNNLAEFTAGTAPTNALSVLRLERVTQNAGGTTVTWQSVTSKTYRVSAREQLVGSSWQELGAVTATNSLAQFRDTTATNAFRFYRVEVLP